MKIAIVALAVLFSFCSFADDGMDSIMSKVRGTCTRLSCPPGTLVIVDAKPGDTGNAMAPDGTNYDLLNLRNTELTIIDNDAEKPVDAKVKTKSGAIYFIQWMFLKKQ